MDESSNNFPDKGTPDNRRRFIQRILGMAGFAVPVVRTFVMASSAVIAPDVYAFSYPTTTPAPAFCPDDAASWWFWYVEPPCEGDEN